jgi:1-acyl-sn-glycerol-3-phosphate acyltransferase
VVCNHVSYLDPLANAYAILRAGRRARFLAKEELFGIPLVGTALRGAGQIPVKRGSRDGSSLLSATRALESGEVVVVYPEGTVTKRPDHLPMDGKTGAVRLALATGLPITPMASWGSQAVWQKSGKGSLKFGRPIWVGAGPGIDISQREVDPPDHERLAALTAEVMSSLTALVEDLRSRYPKRWCEER